MPEQQKPRALVLDMATNRVGEIRDTFTKDGRAAVWLRPRGGGREWTSFRDDVRVLPPRFGAAA